ncbi:ABC transporter related [Parafrankia sp. EAN1pec]|uniref:ABC transporter permease subunit n=1 Tax=Parafrankia sp. (strain EAN1pec) TaxID=298653 RepID=UPI000054496E|nr:ABC transporter related [Frankia sp. EAN1pec]
MSDVLPFLVAGLTTGAVYGLAGTGLVLTYKTSGVFNFAHGAVAALAAYVFYSLWVSQGWPWPVAVAVAVVAAGPVLGLVQELLARFIQGSSLALQVAATVGLLLVVQAVLVLVYGTLETRTVPIFLGSGNVRLAGTNVRWADIATFAFAVVVTAGLSVMFRRARLGLAMRAVVDDPALLDLAGTSPRQTRRFAWCIGATLAAASGVLFAPLLPLDVLQLTLLVVAAFGAAAIGAFTSLPLTFAGGLVIGVLASLATRYFTTGLLAGLPPALPFAVLFLVLLVFPRRYLSGPVRVVPRSRPAWAAPAPLQLLAGVGLLVALGLVPSFAGIHLTDWTAALGTAIVFLSLGLLVRTSGQVSLCHVSFMAIGAAAFSHLAVGHDLPWLVALLVTGLIAVPVGAMLAVPAVRLSGLYLALATFGFGIFLQYMLYTQDYMFGSMGAGLSEPRPHLSWLNVEDDKGFYYLVLVMAVAAVTLLVILDRSRLGRLLRGLAESPTAWETSGVTVSVTRVLVFCVSAFMAAVGGALTAVAQSTVSADAYQPMLSLTYFAVVIVALGGNPWYALTGAGALELIPSYISGENTAAVLQLGFGLAAVGVALAPPTASLLPVAVRRRIDAVSRRPRPSGARAPEGAAAVPAAAASWPGNGAAERQVAAGALEVQDLKVRFGGVLAVDGLSLAAPTGRITGLIGPNGAGKTTTFNACSGLVRPNSGRVLLAGHDVSRAGPAARARRGLGRTFQRMELFDSLPVRDNVAAGAEGALAGGNPLTHLASRPEDRVQVRRATDDALEMCDLTALADTVTAKLSTGQRRLVELARCLAGPFQILLLDEPSSGLDRVETVRFGEILRRVVAERGVGILLVEHDMALVLDICEMIYVLDFGRLVFAGSPGEVVASSVVQAAYLGDTAVEAAVPQTAQGEATVSGLVSDEEVVA